MNDLIKSEKSLLQFLGSSDASLRDFNPELMHISLCVVACNIASVSILGCQLSGLALAQLEISDKFHAISPGERSSAMLQVILPVASIATSIGKLEDAFTIFKIVPE